MGSTYKVTLTLMREMTALGQIEETQLCECPHRGEGSGRPAPVYQLRTASEPNSPPAGTFFPRPSTPNPHLPPEKE